MSIFTLLFKNPQLEKKYSYKLKNKKKINFYFINIILLMISGFVFLTLLLIDNIVKFEYIILISLNIIFPILVKKYYILYFPLTIILNLVQIIIFGLSI